MELAALVAEQAVLIDTLLVELEALRRQVGRGLVLTAFEMGLWRRDILRERLIHHSDKGCQYTSLRFTQGLADAGSLPPPDQSGTVMTMRWSSHSSAA
jgi:transposase InsO family protein